MAQARHLRCTVLTAMCPPHLSGPALPHPSGLSLFSHAGHGRRRHGLWPEPRPGRLLQRPQVVPRPAEARHGAGAGWGCCVEQQAGSAGVPPLLGALCGVLTGCCLSAVSASTAAHADAAALPHTPLERRTGPGTSPPTTTSSCTIPPWSRAPQLSKNPLNPVATRLILMCQRARVLVLRTRPRAAAPILVVRTFVSIPSFRCCAPASCPSLLACGAWGGACTVLLVFLPLRLPLLMRAFHSVNHLCNTCFARAGGRGCLRNHSICIALRPRRQRVHAHMPGGGAPSPRRLRPAPAHLPPCTFQPSVFEHVQFNPALPALGAHGLCPPECRSHRAAPAVTWCTYSASCWPWRSPAGLSPSPGRPPCS